MLDAWKVLTPVLVLYMSQARMRLGAVLCGLVGFFPFAISFSMAASFSVVTRPTQLFNAPTPRSTLYAPNCSGTNNN